jgi:hypothetical protein
MYTIVNDIKIQLADDTVMIRDAKTDELLKAKTFRPFEAMDKYKEIVKLYKTRVAK